MKQIEEDIKALAQKQAAEKVAFQKAQNEAQIKAVALDKEEAKMGKGLLFAYETM